LAESNLKQLKFGLIQQQQQPQVSHLFPRFSSELSVINSQSVDDKNENNNNGDLPLLSSQRMSQYISPRGITSGDVPNSPIANISTAIHTVTASSPDLSRSPSDNENMDLVSRTGLSDMSVISYENDENQQEIKEENVEEEDNDKWRIKKKGKKKRKKKRKKRRIKECVDFENMEEERKKENEEETEKDKKKKKENEEETEKEKERKSEIMKIQMGNEGLQSNNSGIEKEEEKEKKREEADEMKSDSEVCLSYFFFFAYDYYYLLLFLFLDNRLWNRTDGEC
jgi:hypothetical protein